MSYQDFPDEIFVFFNKAGTAPEPFECADESRKELFAQSRVQRLPDFVRIAKYRLVEVEMRSYEPKREIVHRQK